jgi:hypothetical protein
MPPKANSKFWRTGLGGSVNRRGRSLLLASRHLRQLGDIGRKAHAYDATSIGQF